MKKILIIEDEEPMAKALEIKLAQAGFSTQTAFNGKEGLELLRKEAFDLILLDLLMPKMDGFCVLDEMKKIKSGVPVFILTNLGQDKDEKKAKQLGAREFFIKSNTPIADIAERVKKYF